MPSWSPGFGARDPKAQRGRDHGASATVSTRATDVSAANAAAHIAGPLSQRDGSWQPLLYCWRGGQRSGSFATILAQIGWRAAFVEG